MAAYVALGLRYDVIPGPQLISPLVPTIALLIATRTAVNSRMGLYSTRLALRQHPGRRPDRLGGLRRDARQLALFYGLSRIRPDRCPAGFPRSFWPIEMLLSIAILGGVRFAIRAASDWAPHAGRASNTAKRLTLLYGAGRTGVLMARSAQRNPGAGVVPGRLPR